jgi:hypothetical protein
MPRYAKFTYDCPRSIGINEVRCMKINNLRYIFSHLSNIISIFIVIHVALLCIVTTAYAGQVTLGWDPNTEPDLAGYKIYYGTASGNYTESFDVKNWTATSCTITNLIEGQIYYFAATAYNISLVESPYSEEISCAINPAVACQHKFGDMDSDGIVTIDELVTVFRMYYGLDPVNSLVDIDNDGVFQIWEVKEVTNCYLGNADCLCLDEIVAP